MSGPFGGGGGGFGPPNQGGGGFGQPPPGQPPQGGGGFGPPPGGFPTPAAAPMQSVPIDEKPAMIMGLVTAVVCGCVPLGIIGLLVAQQAKTAAANGDRAGAESKLRLSMIISGAGMLLMPVFACLYFGIVAVASS